MNPRRSNVKKGESWHGKWKPFSILPSQYCTLISVEDAGLHLKMLKVVLP
jgi:hypothetical protein